MARRPRKKKEVETLTHDEDARRNIPTAELQSIMSKTAKSAVRIAYERRNRDLDPQLVWRGKDEQDEANLLVQAPPLYIQEKVHPKALIDDLRRQSIEMAHEDAPELPDLFADFNGLPSGDARTEFYQHDANWSNRMILGDSLQVMASLAEREGLRGKVQCIYLDPPYGIKFNSNFQWSTTSRDVKDGKAEHISREPEQVKAFRDTWRDGVHSYLTYLRDRLTAAKDLLSDSGSIFVQIGDENAHRVRALLDEVFGEENLCAIIVFRKTTGANSPVARVNAVASVCDYVLWYARHFEQLKYRQLYAEKDPDTFRGYNRFLDPETFEEHPRSSVDDSSMRDSLRLFQTENLTSSGYSEKLSQPIAFYGSTYSPTASNHWKTTRDGLQRLYRAHRLIGKGKHLNYRRYLDDFKVSPINNVWNDIRVGFASDPKVYVVQTSSQVVQRCLLMTTDPGDLVLDPTCGSGTTAYVAEQWGRRWITIDTSRVALALARARIMGARYLFYLLADSVEGQRKEAELAGTAPSEVSTYSDIRQGFVYERVPHITLRAIANNAEIDVIYERTQPEIEAALADLNGALLDHPAPFGVETGGRKGKKIDFTAQAGSTVTLPSGESAPANGFLAWEVPRDAEDDWNDTARSAHERLWEARIARQREIDSCIAARAEYEHLFDRPYQDNGKVRVAGPFTVESLTPHRVVEPEAASAATPSGEEVADAHGEYVIGQLGMSAGYDFRAVILDQLRTAGVQQADKRGRVEFTSLTGWPGDFICAEGRYQEGNTERRAGLLVGPEHGTVSRADLIAAAREAGDADFDVLIACAFNYDAQSTDTSRLGRLPILKARMNADLQMSTDLKKTKGGNLFVIFGEPDIEILDAEEDLIQVRINGVDLFDPRTGEVRSSEAEDLACWFIDTDYDMESFFVRHAYFLGANDPYKALKTTLRAEIDAEAWQSLRSDTSRPFRKPTSGRVAVKAINHLGDEVMKVLAVR